MKAVSFLLAKQLFLFLKEEKKGFGISRKEKEADGEKGICADITGYSDWVDKYT